MISGGYILQPRIIQESDISVAPPYVREIWNYLLREANCVDNKYNGYEIKRGQLFRSYDDIKEGTKWFIGWRKMTYNENQMKRAMKFLRTTQRIDTKKELGGVMITICNYDYYQNPKNYDRTTIAHIERTIDEPMTNQPLPYTNKNKEELNNLKEDTKKSGGGKKTKENKNEVTPYSEIVEIYHSICKSYPVLRDISPERKNKMRIRFGEMGNIETIKVVFNKMQESKYLQGDNRRGWRATFDWVFENHKNWVKIYEGNYDNKTQKNNQDINDLWKDQ